MNVSAEKEASSAGALTDLPRAVHSNLLVEQKQIRMKRFLSTDNFQPMRMIPILAK